jgi:arylsulfatase A-like enzyme
VAEPAAASLPDVVLITLDTTRADHLPTYGYFRDTAPRLSAFADKSVVFDRMVVPMATTLPTHTSFLTGTYPTEHGILANIEHRGRKFVPTPNLVSWASWLDGLGYQTGGFVSAAPLNRSSGVDKGFQVYTTPPEKRDQRRGQDTVDDALAWLQTTEPSPIFMWVHFYDPHNPFNPPEEYQGLFKRDETMDAWLDERQVSKVTKRPTGDIVRVRPAMNLYDAEIRYMDDQLGRVLDAIEARGRFDNTLFVIAGDHGEGMNQHGQPGHGLVWHEQLHAPLIIRAPGVAPQRVERTVSAVDVLPTALAMVDLPQEDAILKQVSGSDALKGLPEDRYVLSQTSERQLMFGRPMTYTLTNDHWKCVWSEEAGLVLWDHAQDPYELAPATLQHPDVASDCERQLKEMLAMQRERSKELGSGETTSMSDSQRAALEALGYLDDDAGDEH